MADTYWLSFRIRDDAGYERRYENLTEAIKAFADQSCWWFETTSFFVFRSSSGLDDIASHLADAIDTTADLVVVGMPDYKSGRVIGKCDDQDIFKLMPFMKKV